MLWGFGGLGLGRGFVAVAELGRGKTDSLAMLRCWKPPAIVVVCERFAVYVVE
jgi:hypothetical protein